MQLRMCFVLVKCMMLNNTFSFSTMYRSHVTTVTLSDCYNMSKVKNKTEGIKKRKIL